MHAFELGDLAAGARRVLCIGAHADDIEIGCGGLILRLLELNPELELHWVVLSAAGARRAEAFAAARHYLGDAAEKRLEVAGFRDGFLPYQGGEVKEYFEALKRKPPPDLILTHHRGDLHQDHRLASELTWNTFRDHLILEFEIPKYDGDLGAPNCFVPLDEAHVRRKIEILLSAFPSQRSRRWFEPETFRALMKLRGIECNAETGWAEAFHVRKLVLAARALGDPRWPA
ncbi:MAG: PIG-L family deacetylase [Myxococcota bacterium]